MFMGKNVLDIAIVIILIFCSIYSFFKGTIREIFSFLALVSGVFFARQFYHQTAHVWYRWFRPQVSNIIGFVLLFLAGYIIIALLGKLLRKIVHTVQLSWLDHLGGAILGLLKGCFLVCLLVIILVMLLPSGSPLIRTSLLTPYLISLSDVVVKLIPPTVRRNFRQKIKNLKRLKKRLKKRKGEISVSLFSRLVFEKPLLAWFTKSGYSRPFGADNGRKWLMSGQILPGKIPGFLI